MRWWHARLRDRRPPSEALTLGATGLARTATLTSVGETIAAAPRGEGVLVERGPARTPLTVIASSRALAAALRDLPLDGGSSARWGPFGPSPEPPPGLTERWLGRVERVDVPRLPRSEAGTHPDRSRTPPAARRALVAEPGRSWTAVQSHWISLGTDRLLVATRWLVAARPGASAGACLALGATVGRLTDERRGAVRVVWRRPRRSDRRRWRRRQLPARHTARSPLVRADLAARFVDGPAPAPPTLESIVDRHLVVVGSTGSGKTTAVAGVAARWIASGGTACVVDLHGDLAPRVLAAVPPDRHPAIVGLDPTIAGPIGAGIEVLGRGPRDAARVVAAMRRISQVGSDAYWGFRLERIFDVFARLAAEEGGTLVDVHELLTDERRRAAARLATGLPDVARFLDELPAVLRRNPEFLAPAAARIGRLVVAPELAALVAPPSGEGIDLAARLREGTSVLLRLPIGAWGPETAGLVASVLLTRLFLDLADRERSSAPRPILVVLDEAHALAPGLVVELLADSRKFGVAAIVATQYPDRLAPEARRAAAGAAGAHLLFRVPGAAARGVAEWAGWTASEAMAVLPRLPDGWGILATDRLEDGPALVRPPGVRASAIGPWAQSVRSTSRAYGSVASERRADLDADDERILLALFGTPGPTPVRRLVDGLAPAATPPGGDLLLRLAALERRGYLELRAEGAAITAAGARWLGATSEHGSSRESAEHRLLLLEAFRVFARHGERLELVRQGRFDARLPDARLALLGPPEGARIPSSVAAHLDRRRTAWAWRCFHGRDVFVEAEVSGAERRDRLRRDWSKAAVAEAHLVVLVAAPAAGRVARRHLAAIVPDRRRWSVWILRRAAARQPEGATSA